jgi:LPXTG-motif cell wall-anchored protein
MKKVSFMKVNIADTSEPLAGAEFYLYSVTGEGEETERSLIMSGLTYGEDGMLSNGSITQFELPIGTYQLEETKAPAGYNTKESPVIIHIKAGEDTESADYGTAKTLNGVDYDEGTDLSADGKGLKYDSESKVYTMKITNTSGVELPQAGGIGTTIFYVLGSILILGCGIVLAARKRMEGHT